MTCTQKKEQRIRESAHGLGHESCVWVRQEHVGFSSAYIPSYLDQSTAKSLLARCDTLSYTVYQYEHENGVSPVRRAPKVEFYLTNDAGKRPLYRWGQTQQEFWQAGYPMPADLRAIAERIEKETGEKVNHAIVIGYFDGTQGVSVRPGVHTDMSRDGSFFVLSLGARRGQQGEGAGDPRGQGGGAQHLRAFRCVCQGAWWRSGCFGV